MKNVFIIISSILLFFNLIFSKNILADSHVDTCTITSGVFDTTEVITDGYCASSPDAYEVVAYELYFCTANPSAPTTTSVMDLSSCFKNCGHTRVCFYFFKLWSISTSRHYCGWISIWRRHQFHN